MFWATEMDVTIVGLQNAGKTSLVRVLAVSEAVVAQDESAKPDAEIIDVGKRICCRLVAHGRFQ